MKFLLAVLLSFIMMEAPVLAAGYTLPGATNLVGSYAGVLIPTADNIISAASAVDVGTNSLGLFTLSLPSQGTGSGDAIIFSNGRTFTGSIQALQNPDPTSSGIIGILSASFNYSLNETLTGTAGETVSTVTVTAQAQGSFDASVITDGESVGGQGLDLDGTSVINVDQGMVSGSSGVPVVTEEVTFAIEGFEQSDVATTTTGT